MTKSPTKPSDAWLLRHTDGNCPICGIADGHCEHADAEYNNDNPAHREAVIAALQEDGLNAYDYHSGGGGMHVAVDVLEEDGGETLLQIATGSLRSPCEVGVMGWSKRGGAASETWTHTPTLPHIVMAFRTYWANREEYIQRFRAGDLDI